MHRQFLSTKSAFIFATDRLRLITKISLLFLNSLQTTRCYPLSVITSNTVTDKVSLETYAWREGYLINTFLQFKCSSEMNLL